MDMWASEDSSDAVAGLFPEPLTYKVRMAFSKKESPLVERAFSNIYRGQSHGGSPLSLPGVPAVISFRLPLFSSFGCS